MLDPTPSIDLAGELDQLRAAMVTRTVTGQATGLLAARFGVPTVQAWTLLREASNLSNVKLSDLARLVVDTHDDVPFSQDDQKPALALASIFDQAVARVIRP